jgi:small subunit ribosomal protein S21
MTMVTRREDESFDSLLRRFRKKVNQDRLKTEVRKRRYFITKGEKARIAKRKGIQRARRNRRQRSRRSY